MRLIALLAVCALAMSACGGGDSTATATSAGSSPTSQTSAPSSTRPSTSSSTSTTFAPDDADETDAAAEWLAIADPLEGAGPHPVVLAADHDRAWRLVDGTATELPAAEGRLGRVLGDGAGVVVAELLGRDAFGSDVPVGLARLDDGAWVPVEVPFTDELALHDLLRTEAGTWFVLSRFDDDPEAEPSGMVQLFDPVSGRLLDLTEGRAPEFGVITVSAAAEQAVVSAWSDLTESVAFYAYGGERIDRPSPTDDLPYNSPPFVTGAVLSPDGTELAYLEGPDVDGASGDGSTQVGDWEIVVEDPDGEQLRVAVASTAVPWVTLDFDGRWIIVSAPESDLAPLLIDSESVDVATYELRGVSGEATLDSAALQAVS